MAAKVINDINEKVLLCSICQERFDSPKTLSCQHSFCLKCIEGWVNKNRGVLSCPMCRREFDIPKKGLIELPSSYFINQLLEYTADVEGKTLDANSCVMCNSSAAAHCMECSTYLCSQCAGNHCKLPSCRSHTVIPLEKYKSMDAKERAAAKPVVCPKHNDVAVEFYCAGCSMPVCMKCTVVGHKGHELQELDTAFEVFKANAKETLAGCSSKVDEINAELKKHSEDTEKQKQSANKCTEEVKLYAKKLHQMIDVAERKALDNITKHSESLLQTRGEERLVKIDKLKQLQNVSVFIESLIEAPQPTAALFDANKSVKEAENLINKPQHTSQIDLEHQQLHQLQQRLEETMTQSLTRNQRRKHLNKQQQWPQQQVVQNNVNDKNTPAISFNFEENKQLAQSAVSIGNIRCQNLKYPKQSANQQFNSSHSYYKRSRPRDSYRNVVHHYADYDSDEDSYYIGTKTIYT